MRVCGIFTLVMNDELLQRLVAAMESNEKAQQAFQKTVLLQLAKIESMLLMVQMEQVAAAAERHRSPSRMADHLQLLKIEAAKASADLGQELLAKIKPEADDSDSSRSKTPKRSRRHASE